MLLFGVSTAMVFAVMLWLIQARFTDPRPEISLVKRELYLPRQMQFLWHFKAGLNPEAGTI